MSAPALPLLPVLAAALALSPAAGVYFFSRGAAPPTPPPPPPPPPRPPPCVCSAAEWCAPVTTPKTTRSEVFAFVLNSTEETWRTFDWQKLTTVVLFNFFHPDIVCLAHKNNVRVLLNANFLKANVTNATYRASWARQHVNYTALHFLDGINVDFEDPISAKEPARAGFVQLMNETQQFLKEYSVWSQLTVDVPWSPNCVDGRCYDFPALANVTDMFFVMGYDLRSAVFAKDCIAGANSPLNQTLAGVRSYLQLGVPASQLVLGVPWYGYDYTCLNVTHNGTVCRIGRVRRFGANCSDAVGTERPYKGIASWSRHANPNFWSNDSQSPYFNVKFPAWNFTHQIWYDNATSLTYKYMGAASLKLRGAGIWAANFLATGNSTDERKQRDLMWGALPRWNWQADDTPPAAAGPATGRR